MEAAALSWSISDIPGVLRIGPASVLDESLCSSLVLIVFLFCLDQWLFPFWWMRSRLGALNNWEGGSDGKESACNSGDLGLIPGSEISPGGGHTTHFSVLTWRIPCLQWSLQWSHNDLLVCNDHIVISVWTHMCVNFYTHLCIWRQWWVEVQHSGSGPACTGFES